MVINVFYKVALSFIKAWTNVPENIIFEANGENLKITMDGKTVVVTDYNMSTGTILGYSMLGNIDVYKWVVE